MYYRNQTTSTSFVYPIPDLRNGPEALVVPFSLATFSSHVLYPSRSRSMTATATAACIHHHQATRAVGFS